MNMLFTRNQPGFSIMEKYASTGHVSFVVPAPLSKQLTARIQRMAVQAFQAVDGSGLLGDFFGPEGRGTDS